MTDKIGNDLKCGDLVLAVPYKKITPDFKMYALVTGKDTIFMSKYYNNDNFTTLKSKNYSIYKLDVTNVQLEEIYTELTKKYNEYTSQLIHSTISMKSMKPGTIIETYDRKNKYWIYLGIGTVNLVTNNKTVEGHGYVYITLASFLNTYGIIFRKQHLNRYSTMFDIDKILSHIAYNSNVSSVFCAVECPKIIKSIKGYFEIDNISVNRHYYSTKIIADIKYEI